MNIEKVATGEYWPGVKAKELGFRVTCNTTIFDNVSLEKAESFFDSLKQLNIDGITVSSGFQYEDAPDQEHFMGRKKTFEYFDQLFSMLDAMGIPVMYGTKALSLLEDRQARVSGVVARGRSGVTEIRAEAVILACGGFEANAEMRARYLGPGWELAKVRGVPYNTGDGIRMALDVGAQSYGHWSGCHEGCDYRKRSCCCCGCCCWS